MKPAERSLCLDLTTWVRGPTTAVGLCALRMTVEIAKLASEFSLALEIFSRQPMTRDQREALLKKVPTGVTLGWAPRHRRWCAKHPGQVYVSFDHRSSPVRGARRVIVVHDAWTLRQNPWQSESFARTQRPKILSAIARADLIFCPSEVVAAEVRVFDRKATARVHVLPWASMIDVAEAPEANFTSRNLAMVATFDPRKNHALARRLATQLGPEWRWIFVGAPGFRAEDSLRAVNDLRERGYRVQHLAHLAVAEVAGIYREAFAVLCPSFEEGFGLTVLEGLTLGRPVWASRTPTHREVGAEAVSYFDPLGSDLENLAHEIRALARDESAYRERIARGRRRAADFDWSRSARRFLELVG